MSKTVMITGAGSGFGKGASLALAARGHSVIATTETEEQAEALRAEAPELTVEKLDITTADVAKAAEWDIDVLINNAGAGQTGPMADVPIDRVRRLFEVNVFGTLAVTQHVLPRMVAKGAGRIIIVSSIAGVVSGPAFGPYSMTKHALEAMGKAMRAELARQGIDVTLLNPGPYLTGFNDRMADSMWEWFGDDVAQRAGHAVVPDDARARHRRADGSGRGRHPDGRAHRGRDHDREQLRPARDPRPDDRAAAVGEREPVTRRAPTTSSSPRGSQGQTRARHVDRDGFDPTAMRNPCLGRHMRRCCAHVERAPVFAAEHACERAGMRSLHLVDHLAAFEHAQHPTRERARAPHRAVARRGTCRRRSRPSAAPRCVGLRAIRRRRCRTR